MPAKRNIQVKPKPSAIDGSFYCNGEPFVMPKETRTSLENRIINRIRIIGDDEEASGTSGITLTMGRKLIKAALKNNQLSINIGSNPYDSEDEHESSHHPLSPQYKYCGKDVRKLEPLLITDHTMLECTATLSYGDGGMSIETNDDVQSAIDILTDNYREPEFILYF
jgi:hypothetical protein